MSTMQMVLIAAIGVSLVVSFIMKMPSASRKAARKALADAPWLSEGSADGATVKIAGVVKMREHGERFVSPLSETRCVVMRMRVLVRHGQSPKGKLVDKTEIKPFVVETEDGKFLVESDHVLLDIGPARQPKNIDPKKGQYLGEIGFKDGNVARSEFEETVVEVGAQVAVAGTLGKEPLRITGTKDQPIAIRLEGRGDTSHRP
jgi:hypothetical protein